MQYTIVIALAHNFIALCPFSTRPKPLESPRRQALQRFLSRQKRIQREKVMIQNKPGDGNGKAPKLPKFLMVRWPHGPLWDYTVQYSIHYNIICIRKIWNYNPKKSVITLFRAKSVITKQKCNYTITSRKKV